MRKGWAKGWMWILAIIMAVPAYAAYHHEGEEDSGKFLNAYPAMKDTKLDHCATCHTGGQYESKGSYVTLGSCQWCHYSYGYDGSGNIVDTLNTYGKDYYVNGRDVNAFTAIASADSDKDGYSNEAEITAGKFPGDAKDDPSKVTPPYRVYTREQIEAMDQHTQFMLMNTSRSGDFYAQYEGVPLKELFDAAGILSSATGITVYAPDGWSQYHPITYDDSAEFYHVYGNFPDQSYQYPPASFYYVEEAEGWCDYASPYVSGRNHNDPITVENGLKAILAIKVDGAYLETGALNEENKLDGDGPFRIVVPQKNPGPPDQSSKAADQNVTWPYDSSFDHNAGACTRSATIIRVEPLPEGTTDLDIYEDGWNYVNQGKIIIYGAIDGTDSNGNGILDTAEGSDNTKDYDKDTVPDYKDTDTASLTPATGEKNFLLWISKGQFSQVQSLTDTDTGVSQEGKPEMAFTYGLTQFQITGLSSGDSISLTMVLPDNVPTTATYYKVDGSGWHAVALDGNDGDTTITLSFTDGDSGTDADGLKDGRISHTGALAFEASGSSSKDNDDDKMCFLSFSPPNGWNQFIMIVMGVSLALSIIGTAFRSDKK